MPPALPRIASASRLLARLGGDGMLDARLARGQILGDSPDAAHCLGGDARRPARRHRRKDLYPRPRRAPQPPPRSAASASDRSAGWLPSCSSPCTAFSNVRPWSTDEPTSEVRSSNAVDNPEETWRSSTRSRCVSFGPGPHARSEDPKSANSRPATRELLQPVARRGAGSTARRVLLELVDQALDTARQQRAAAVDGQHDRRFGQHVVDVGLNRSAVWSIFSSRASRRVGVEGQAR